MANVNRIILDKNGIDEIHYKTNAGQVVTADGDTVENKINTINDKIANSQSNISITVNGQEYTNSNGNITLPNYPDSPNYFFSMEAPEGAKEKDIWYQIDYTPVTESKMTFDYKNSAQEYSVTKDGQYFIRCYGARGGYRNSNSTYAGKGGITSGVVSLKKGDTLYIYTGQNGNCNITDSYTFNGGGKGAASYQYGGGATDVRLVGGDWDDEASLLSRIIVAGGGGSCGGTTKAGGDANTSATSGFGTGGHAGTQTEGGAGSTTDTSTKGLFGKGGHGVYRSSGYGGAGGGGWYGGAGNYPDTSGDDDKGGGGGSSYILTATSAKPDNYSPDSRFYFVKTSIENTNTKTNGAVEIYETSSSVVGTFVYKDGEWNATASKVDTDSIMNTDTYSKLSTTNKTIVGAINEVFQSVSSGKSSIAKAITSKGVTANASDSFSSLANKINLIKSKKYDTGETLNKGEHFEFLKSFGADDFHERYPNVEGEIQYSSSKRLLTRDSSSYSTYYLYDYDKESDTFESAVSPTFVNSGISRIVGNYGISAMGGSMDDEILVSLVSYEGVPSPPDAFVPPGETIVETKHYYYEWDEDVYLFSVSSCQAPEYTPPAPGEPPTLPVPPSIYVSCFKLVDDSFEIVTNQTLEINLDLGIYTSNPEDLRYKFAINDSYLLLIYTLDGTECFITMYRLSDFYKVIPTQFDNSIPGDNFLAIVGDKYAYDDYDGTICLRANYSTSYISSSNGYGLALPEGSVMIDKTTNCMIIPTVDSGRNLKGYISYNIDNGQRSEVKIQLSSPIKETGKIIAGNRFESLGYTSDYSTIILK